MNETKNKLKLNNSLTHEAILQIKDAIKENDRTPKKIVKPLLEELQYRNELNEKLFKELLDQASKATNNMQFKIDLILQAHNDVKKGKKHLQEMFDTLDRLQIGNNTTTKKVV